MSEEAATGYRPRMANVMEVKGHGGTIVRFDGNTITIIRQGLLARATTGKGKKDLPLAHITGVQFKPAGPLVNGFIQFTIDGGNEKQSAFGRQTTDAVKDENSAIFTSKQRAGFEALRDEVRAALAQFHERPAPSTDANVATDIPGQIQELARLRDAGVLTDVEFNAKRIELLGRL
jgi:hypothetical protein